MKTNKFYYWLLTISAVVLLFNSTQLSAQTCTTPPAGMVAWFPGDGNANDIQGGNNGTPNGGITFTAGKVAQAFNFDGTGDVTYPTINAGSTYTLDFWMRPTLAGVYQHVISNIANSTNYGSLRFFNDHVEYLQSGAFQFISPAGSVPLNTYTHIALTYDGSVNRLYINGSLAATSGVHTETFNNQLSLGFTIFNNYGESRFNGQIDEVEIFNRALLQAEIQAIVAAGSAGKCKPPITFIVNTTSDTDDGTCNATHCSLREAIIAANANSITSSPDRIHFNIPGSGPHTIMPTTALPTVTDPVVIDGYTQPNASVNTATDGSTNAVLLIEINGSAAPINSNGLTIATNDSTVRGLIINRFQSNVNGDVNAGSGIGITGNSNVVEGNFLGTDSSGTADLGNRNHGVFVSGGLNRIGGTTPAARNLISGNGAGDASFNGSGAAVIITGSAATGNIVEGNLIGTDRTGNFAVANVIGIYTFSSANNNILGGTAAGSRNVISGNTIDGILLETTGNTVQGNYIGTTASGNAALGNVRNGIVAFSGANGNSIGGTTTAARNVISGNSGVGIDLIFNDQNIVQGNFIGTDAAGIGNLGNGSFGIRILFSNTNTIGGTAAGAGNTIAFNADTGVFVSGAPGTINHRILGNSIFNNVGIGIDLQDAATTSNVVTANDPGDTDTGGNNLQNYPVLTSAMSGASAATVQGTFNSMPSMTFRVEFFSNPACDSSGFGEGQTFIGFQSVTTDASGNATVSFTSSGAVAAGQFITSTATDPNGNTSEFSACRVVLGPTAATVSVGGRITTSSGFGISQARVSITDAKGETHTVLSDESGYYHFDQAEAGQTYIVSVSRKRYQFMPSTQVVSVREDLNSVDFMALPLQRMKQR